MSFVTRPNALLGMLALAAFAIALAFTNRDRLPSAEIVIAGDGDAPAAASAQRAFPKHDQPPPPPANAPPAEQPALAREPTAEQLQTIARLSEQVMPPGETTSEDAEKRGDAIRQLATLPGPQAAQALVHAVRNDVDPRNRILAVEALRRAAADGDANWVIRDALREASSSSDEVIATQARAAYDDLIAQLGTQR